ncbi:MAG TPA: hypothetical protein G4N99_14240 [Thermoflexia bacterium]|nr:hypothetical protein [Thermoflexia bacterium]
MEHDSHFPVSRPASGGLIRLQARLTNPAAMWAAVCGVVASGGFGWQGGDFLRLALLILLADGGWGTLWAAIGATDWATPLRRWRNWRFGEPVSAPPYTLPNSPGDRVSRWLGQLRVWRRDVLWPTCGPAISAIAVALPVTAALSALLGPNLLLLSLAALAVMQLSLAWEGCSALVAVMFPWLAGHVAFGSLTPASAGLALAFTLAWGANRQAESPWVRALGIAAQFLALAFLLALRQPLTAGMLALLLAPQLALLPWLRRGQAASWYTRHARPWLMTAMLVAAWTL